MSELIGEFTVEEIEGQWVVVDRHLWKSNRGDALATWVSSTRLAAGPFGTQAEANSAYQGIMGHRPPSEPRIAEDGSEDVSFEAVINGHPIRILVGRETLEDHLGVPDSTSEDRVHFVRENQRLIIRNVTNYLRGADDVDGIRLTDALLR